VDSWVPDVLAALSAILKRADRVTVPPPGVIETPGLPGQPVKALSRMHPALATPGSERAGADEVHGPRVW